MLQLILGRSGFGKTRWIHDQVAAWAEAPTGPVYLLVPEQFSFETERALLEQLGPVLANRVQVITFSRLAETLCPPQGGGRMDDTVRTLLMSEALAACADRLTLYRQHTADPDYIACLLSLLTECKQSGIFPALLTETAAALPDNALKHKTEELGLILAAYEALVGQAYTDPLDDLSTLAEHLRQHPLPASTRVAVDAFHGFTGQEMAVLQCLIEQAEQVTIGLCTDTLDTAQDSGSPFAPVSRTADRLVGMARDAHIGVAAPVHLTERRRTADPALCHIEENTFGVGATPLTEPTTAVTLLSCDDIYAECEAVARLIRRQVRQEGGHYRDVSIVVRRLDDYRGVLDAALEKQGIAYYLDSRRNVMTDSLFALTMAALQAASGDWSTDMLLRVAKSGLVGLSSPSVAKLENYAYIWRVNGRRWRQEWVDHPDGLSVKFDDTSRERLQHLNRLRRRLIAPLESLSAALHAPAGLDGEAFARAIYRYLLDARADRFLRMQAQRMQAAGEVNTAERLSRLWPLLMGVLDTFAQTLKGHTLPADRLVELFRLVISATDLGEIPQTLDSVQIGSADRIRFAAPRTVFVLGANEGVFPAYPTQGNLWSVADRQRLAEAGLPLTDTGDDAILQEWLYAYYALAAPSERLYVSFLRGNASGKTLLPSTMVESIRRLLPGCVSLNTADMAADVESGADMLDTAARGWRQASPLEASLKEVLATKEELQPRLQMLQRMAEEKPAGFADAAVARRFFGEDMRLSPSRVERYHQCRFAYFCQYGLRVNPRRPADLDALEFGTLAHYVMEQLLPAYTAQGFDEVHRPQIKADVSRMVEAYTAECMGGTENRPARFLHQLEQLKRLCERLMWQVVKELRQSRFVPTDFELEVGQLSDEDVPRIDPIVLTLPDGARIRVQGKVDRVDVYEQDGMAYVRIIDYKTGSKEFRLSDVVEGINLQMLIYMMSIWQNGGERYGDVRPAGLLYLPAKLPVLKVERFHGEDDLEKQDLKAMKMNGLLLDDPAILRAMEAEAAGVFIPASLTAKGAPGRGSSVASLAQFGQLKKRVERLLTDMAVTLRQGDIAAVPACGAVDACAYCDYRAVCGFEEGLPMRYIAKKDAADVWNDLAAEEGSHE